ncbi:MAG: hypothetical protein E6J91_00885 [Deltaproteobacteria bacterium]|nr:MAG: hypothetical protein E6J91_00885 [Deltaproteobacteria bacterium]
MSSSASRSAASATTRSRSSPTRLEPIASAWRSCRRASASSSPTRSAGMSGGGASGLLFSRKCSRNPPDGPPSLGRSAPRIVIQGDRPGAPCGCSGPAPVAPVEIAALRRRSAALADAALARVALAGRTDASAAGGCAGGGSSRASSSTIAIGSGGGFTGCAGGGAIAAVRSRSGTASTSPSHTTQPSAMAWPATDTRIAAGSRRMTM